MNKTTRTAETTVIWLMGITALTKVFGFLREILFGRWYGVSEIAEAFKIAQTIPMVLLLIVGTGISTSFIPIYSRLEKHSGSDSADRFMSNLINLLVLFSLLFSLLVSLFPGLFVKLFASGFAGSKYDLTILYTQIAVWGTLFNMATYVLAPYLQIRNQYLAPALMVIPGNLVFILCFYLGRFNRPLLVGLSIVLAIIVQLLWLIPFVKRQRYRHSLRVDLSDPSLSQFLILAAPVVIGVAVNQINLMVDKNIASFTLDGGVAILDYANRMTSFVQAIFIYPVAAVFFPHLTRAIIDQDIGRAKDSTSLSLISLTLIILPCAAGLMLFAQPIVDLFFGGQVFTPEAVQRTAQAMFWYATGLLFFAWRDIFVRVFYAWGNTRTPTFNAIISVIINIVLNLVLSRFYGLNGLAMATSISALIGSLLMMRGMSRHTFSLDYARLINRLLKGVIATALMSAGAWWLFQQLSRRLALSVSLGLSIILAIFIYAAVLWGMRLPEANQLIRSIRNKL